MVSTIIRGSRVGNNNNMKSTLPNPGIAFALDAIQQHFNKVAPLPFRLTEPPKLPPTKTDGADTVVRPKPSHPDFPYTIDRSFEGQGEIELAIEVTYYKPPGNNKYLDHRDPAYSPGEIEFGHAIEVATGKTVELTAAEWQAVEESFWN